MRQKLHKIQVFSHSLLFMLPFLEVREKILEAFGKVFEIPFRNGIRFAILKPNRTN